MNIFPSSWNIKKANIVCVEIVDCVNKTAPVVDGPTPYKMIRTTNVRNGRIDVNEARYVDEATFIKWTRRVVPRRNDIVLTREAPLGEVGLLRSDEKVFLGQRTMLYRADPSQLNQHFLYYSMIGPTVQAQISAQGNGSTVEHLRVPDAENLKIPVAPLSDQKKIAAILTAYDDLIENNNRRIALLEKMAEELYREWFVRLRFPGHEQVKIVKGVPEGWSVKRFREIVSYYIGGGWGEENQSAVFSEDGYVIRGTDIPGFNGGSFEPVYRFHKPSNLKSRILQAGDFVFEVSGGSKDQLLGRNVMLTQKAIDFLGLPVMCASFCKQIRFDSKIISSFFMKYFMKLYYDSDLVGLYQIQSTGISNYQFEAFLKNQTILIPSEALQKHFDSIIVPMLELKDDLSVKNMSLKKTRDMLLPRLISGKLSVEALDIQFPPSMQDAA